MQLDTLLADVPDARLLDSGNPEIRGVSCDSRTVRPGDLFAAVRGERHDGHAFLPEAARAGAVACLVEEEETPGYGMVRVRTPDAEVALGQAASAFWRHPSRRLRLVGITGTNGKTTAAYLVQHLLATGGVPAGRLGTVSYAFPTGDEPAPLTTPGGAVLHRALDRMAREGAGAAVMEVSSHALERGRVAGATFACTAFTNQSQDHLDYHGSMEEYFQAKRLLFTRYGAQAPAVINAEDPFGRRLLEELGSRAVSYGLAEGQVRLAVTELSARGLRGRLHYPGGEVPLEAPLVGAFNAQNVACALAVLWALGRDVEAGARGLTKAPQVPGRVERIANDRGVGVFVDYAHTPDALARVLASVREVTAGRLLCVFGCGGDRDPGKRPLMGRAAADVCDALVLTADNSRSEPTESILDAIEPGLPQPWRRGETREDLDSDRVYVRVPDRARAIRWAVAAARPGDSVVVAGKGHERIQTIGDRSEPFDDRVEARAALREETP